MQAVARWRPARAAQTLARGALAGSAGAGLPQSVTVMLSDDPVDYRSVAFAMPDQDRPSARALIILWCTRTELCGAPEPMPLRFQASA